MMSDHLQLQTIVSHLQQTDLSVVFIGSSYGGSGVVIVVVSGVVAVVSIVFVLVNVCLHGMVLKR
jgi:hypothetical protein